MLVMLARQRGGRISPGNLGGPNEERRHDARGPRLTGQRTMMEEEEKSRSFIFFCLSCLVPEKDCGMGSRNLHRNLEPLPSHPSAHFPLLFTLYPFPFAHCPLPSALCPLPFPQRLSLDGEPELGPGRTGEDRGSRVIAVR